MSATIIAMNHGRLEDALSVLQEQIGGNPECGKAKAAITVVEWENGGHQVQLFGDDMSPAAMAGVACLLSRIASSAYLAQMEDE